MHFGICGGPELAFIAAQAGFDYFEWTVGDFCSPGTAGMLSRMR